MSASVAPGRRAAPNISARALWIVAADCAILALAAAQTLAHDQRLVVVLTLAAVAAVALTVLAARSLSVAIRSGALLRLITGSALAAAMLGVLVLGRATVGWRPVVLAVAAFAGLALVLRWLVAAVEQRDAHTAPWRELAAGVAPPPRARRRDAALAATGAALLVRSGIGAARYAMDATHGGPPFRGVVAGVVIVAVLMALVAGPIALVSQARARRAWADRERGRQRQAVAAHLHDSVLQTLALIQRSAGDEQAVLHLARQQERGLRDWLAGRDDPSAASVGAALRAVAAAVEDEVNGAATIDVIVVDDAPLDATAEVLVQAAREALRNAARHAGGIVRVVIDPDPASGELVVFIRDAGGGFDPEQVPAERRGIRDAIIGRMTHAGGTATIESGPDGTEIILRAPASTEPLR